MSRLSAIEALFESLLCPDGDLSIVRSGVIEPHTILVISSPQVGRWKGFEKLDELPPLRDYDAVFVQLDELVSYKELLRISNDNVDPINIRLLSAPESFTVLFKCFFDSYVRYLTSPNLVFEGDLTVGTEVIAGVFLQSHTTSKYGPTTTILRQDLVIWISPD